MRRKRSLPKKRAPREPREIKLTEATKRSGTEFGVASSSGAIIRKAFSEIVSLIEDRKLVNRLNKRLIEIIQSSPSTNGAVRQLMDCNVAPLVMFNFSSRRGFGGVFHPDAEIKIVPLSNLIVTLPEFDIKSSIVAPSNCNQAILITTCCVIGFNNEKDYSSHTEELELDLTQKYFPGGSVEFGLTGADNCLIAVGMAISFINEKGYRKNNALWLVGEIIYAVIIKNGELMRFEEEKTERTILKKVEVKKSSWKINEA